LWDARGATFTFYAGAGFASLAMVVLAIRPARALSS